MFCGQLDKRALKRHDAFEGRPSVTSRSTGLLPTSEGVSCSQQLETSEKRDWSTWLQPERFSFLFSWINGTYISKFCSHSVIFFGLKGLKTVTLFSAVKVYCAAMWNSYVLFSAARKSCPLFEISCLLFFPDRVRTFFSGNSHTLPYGAIL